MTDVRLLFPHEYLSAADLRGKDVHLTIARVEMGELKTDRGTEKKPIVTFREIDAKRARGETCPWKWVLNKTCAKAIGKALGTYEIEEWPGKRITLYPTTCQAFGQIVDCVRVREKAAPPPKQRKPQPKPEPEPDVYDDEPPYGELEGEEAAE